MFPIPSETTFGLRVLPTVLKKLEICRRGNTFSTAIILLSSSYSVLTSVLKSERVYRGSVGEAP